MSDLYNHITYRNCPHFTIGRVDQWGEEGYLFFEGQVYEYYENRKDQMEVVSNPKSVTEFTRYITAAKLDVPADFLDALKGT